MPEGDTVWRTAQALDKALTGARITLSDFRVPQLAEVDLTGKLVNGTISRGKHLLTRIGDDHTLHSHLRMEGAWHLYRAETRWQRPVDQARVVLRTPRWIAVGFSLGILELLTRDREVDAVGHLGPDLLGDDWNPDEAVRRLRRDRDRPIGEALLDQRNLAGIGNLYENELCFLSGVLPGTPVRQVDNLERLVGRAKAMLEANKGRRTQTTTGNTRHGHQHWVYGRAEQPCQRCGTTVQTGMLGPAGQERPSFWCPSCQR
ncbi:MULTISPECIES: DNA-formamidopyrimidine glycosylase family protein [unclassified Nocardioides]|uniref:DNA-formamidopyrimidine glycosylase family protein n=1 Tax=unclassified Nocardioides TaxID=2615069 RepID=UPI0006F37967|nr:MULTISPECIES: DNA-formamidopyrimidine glycosylase family protein [unclassified Nocardioides]KQY64163.1 DNA glycosylase [Nocardioides sp. Root140]KQZ70084.1 DNA glycosylase [Nocardioides sp. Root151]KRF16181.1 DNA glycosylase [Nocardioides sp. Soil796]